MVNQSEGIQYYPISERISGNRAYRSWAWKHFLYNEEMKEAKCKYCSLIYNLKEGTTSGMLKHIRS